MFTVNRFNPDPTTNEPPDPDATASRETRKPKAPNDEADSRVIAEEQPQPKRPKLSVNEESIDDLIKDEPIEGQNRQQSSTSSSHLTEEEIQVATRLAQKPIVEVANAWNLAPFLVRNLQRDGFEHFFPIQALTIPDVITTERNPHLQVRDICVAAPTGSGKTLGKSRYTFRYVELTLVCFLLVAYVIPLLNSLSQRSGGPRRLRALVVLPSRELALQVFQVVQNYTKGSSLRVGTATGQSPLVPEQKVLTLDVSRGDPATLRTLLTTYDPGNLEAAMQLFRQGRNTPARIPAGGWSNVDLLVCTPGRLVDHMENTPGFTLQHLRFLVVDEADRLLSHSYNRWVDRILQATSTPAKSGDGPGFDPVTVRQSSAAVHVQLRKFLVSATLTNDPQKLAPMRLLNPKHFDVRLFHDHATKYSVPDELEEFVVECTTAQKPLGLVSLLLERATNESKAIIFTSRLDSTHRLARLLQLVWLALGFEETCIGEFSGALNRIERSAMLERCSKEDDNLSIIVCSDAMSRGMDIRVDTAINYDIPVLAKTYVHRCGRTARATRKGEAISLVKGGQMGQFRRMRHLIRCPERVQTLHLQKEALSKLVGAYKESIANLRRVVEAESHGELRTSDFLSSFIQSETP